MENRQPRFWNSLKADWYLKGLKYSSLPDLCLNFILPKTARGDSFLDVGAGCGTLAIPLAAAGRQVTAIDPSLPMITLLRAEAEQRGLTNLTSHNVAWDEYEKCNHDVIICANVPELLQGPTPFLDEVDRWAGKAVFIITGADPRGNKFYYRELYPLLFDKEYPPRGDYLTTYAALHARSIFANVEMLDYRFDQPFQNLEEALAFWREYLGLVTDEHDRQLAAFLEKKLEKHEEGLIARFHKKAAIIWWRKEEKSTPPRKP